MKKFLDKHAGKITASISCFDRIVFKGHLPLGWPGAVESLLERNAFKLKDFKNFASAQSERLTTHAKAFAGERGRPYLYLRTRLRKDDFVRDIAKRDQITDGLVCVLSAVEPCSTFKIAFGKNAPRLESARRKCLFLYFYFLDREFGLLHVRLQTWLPFSIQICLNGHEWLARKLTLHGVGHKKKDNAFLEIDDPKRAQRFADGFQRKKWPRVLSAFARRVNPLLADLLNGMDYYWVIDQAEYSTDVLFRDPPALQSLYKELLKHATENFSAEDVMTFLGRRLNGNFEGEIQSRYTTRWPGARIKHRVKENWIKMYDKIGRVLRIETVINRPYDFKALRYGKRKGERIFGWFPMAKCVGNIGRYAEICAAANARYLDALAVVPDTSEACADLRRLAAGVRKAGRIYRGFNPTADDDAAIFAATLRGEHAISGFRNKDIRAVLASRSKTQDEARKQGARVSRILKRLHVHGLIAKIPRSRRWRVTAKGQQLMTTLLAVHKDYIYTYASSAA